MIKKRFVCSLLFLCLLFTASHTSAEKVTDVSTNGFQKVWTFSSGTGQYAPMAWVGDTMPDGGIIYSLRGVNGIQEIGRLNASGKTVWKKASLFNNYFSTKDHLIVFKDDYDASGFPKGIVALLRKSDGATISSFPLSKVGLDSTDNIKVSVDGENRIFITSEDTIRAISTSGKLLWKKEAGIHKEWKPYMSYHEAVNLGNGEILTWTNCSGSFVCREAPIKKEVLKLDAATGKVLWSTEKNVSINYPIIHRDQIILADYSSNGKVYALDKKTGKERWSYPLPNSSYPMLYEGLTDEEFIFISAGGPNDIGGYVTNYIIALDHDGQKRWSVTLPEASYRITGLSPDRKIVYAEGDKASYHVDAQSGKLLKTIPYQRTTGAIQTTDIKKVPKLRNIGYQLVGTDGSYKNNKWTERYNVFTKNGGNIGQVTVQKVINNRNLLMHTTHISDPVMSAKHMLYLTHGNTIKAYKPKQRPVSITINGEYIPMDQPGLIIGSSTMVPIRFIADHAKATTEWNQKTKQVHLVSSSGDKLTLTVGSKKAYKNGKLQTLEAAPQSINGRVLVPLRYITENLGATVNWVQEEQKVEITWN